MQTRKALVDALSQFSALKGKDLDLVQGQGGNSSVKTNGQLIVKGSGARLEEAARREIFVACDLEKCRLGFRQRSESAIKESAIGDAQEMRPSIETSLHAMLPGKFVFHYHCVNAIAATVDGAIEKEKKSAIERLGAVKVAYVKPGLPLTAAMLDAGAHDAPVFILQNHGVIVQAESLDEIDELMTQVADAINTEPAFPIKEGERSLDAFANGWNRYVDEDMLALGRLILSHPDLRNETLYPDHAVILGHGVPESATDNERGWYISTDGAVVVRDDRRVVLEPMLEALLRVCARLNLDAERSTLSKDDVSALLNWDAEKARIKIANQRLGDQQ